MLAVFIYVRSTEAGLLVQSGCCVRPRGELPPRGCLGSQNPPGDVQVVTQGPDRDKKYFSGGREMIESLEKNVPI